MQTIIELERMAAEHWRGTEEEWLGQWLLRAADGFTGRANSVLPLGDPGMPLADALAEVSGWYRSRGLPPMIAIPTPIGETGGEGGASAGLDGYLAGHNWLIRTRPAFLMVAGLPLGAVPRDLPPGTEFVLDAEPDPAWLARYRADSGPQSPVMREVLTSAREQVFASFRSGADVQAIARLSVAGNWAGISAVEVHPDRRRAGLGRAITTAVCAEASARGISQVFLQVEVENEPARALYERCDFRYSHRYHYRVAPE